MLFTRTSKEVLSVVPMKVVQGDAVQPVPALPPRPQPFVIEEVSVCQLAFPEPLVTNTSPLSAAPEPILAAVTPPSAMLTLPVVVIGLGISAMPAPAVRLVTVPPLFPGNVCPLAKVMIPVPPLMERPPMATLPPPTLIGELMRWRGLLSNTGTV